MNTFTILTVLALLGTASVMAAPNDQIDVQAIKARITLHLGDKGLIQFKRDGNTLAEPKLIQSSDEKAPGVEVEFKKEPEFLMLNLKNRFPKGLFYRAAIRLKGRTDYVETSLITPVGAGLLSLESWQDLIEELVLFDFKLTDENP
jgi:hypothetical protein